MKPRDYVPGLQESVVIIIIGILYLPLLVYVAIANIIDYRILKRYYCRKRKWGLNICCGNTDGGRINADIVGRNVPNFVLLKDIYKLLFKDKEFENVICSHTMEHTEDPDKFYEELRRVSRNVTLLVPPIWDVGCIGCFQQHKWQFLTFRTKHVNSLPNKFKLPYWGYQKRFGQSIRG
ncbi:MAG: methyltransferase domain-containing protein [Candidatus Aenigmarchaeota archaeon]|nr:methyltransferase domain-containing protein [Candidatus Aenigmarchaeota archaeon]